MLEKTLRFAIIFLCVIGGLMTMDRIVVYLPAIVSAEFLSLGFFGITLATVLSFLFGGLLGGLFGILVAPFLVSKLWQFTYWIEAKLNKMPVNDVLAGSLGLAIGLIISNLLGSAFLPIPVVGKYFPGCTQHYFGVLRN